MAKKIRKHNSQYKHRDCVYAKDLFDLNYLGEPILCRCQYKDYALLLNDPACEQHFKQK